MTLRRPKIEDDRLGFDSFRLELSLLVGQEMFVYSEQFPGIALAARVQSVKDRELQVSQSGPDDRLENLIENQQIILQFPYRGQKIAVKALFKKCSGGRGYMTLDEKVVPLSQRKFRRVGMINTVKLAAFPLNAFNSRNILRLRWKETRTINFSSGGVLLNSAAFLEQGTYMLLNIDVPETLFPPLVLGRVCHCSPAMETSFRTGLEFIVKERGEQLVSAADRKHLPPVIFTYTSVDREKLNKLIKAGKL
ncbi:MAG: hypothetical protein ACOYVF_01290 [Candidatus Zixiibacteriota bacterium]